MSWGRVDDKLVEHPKWVRLEREFGGRTWADALAIWTWVLCYTSRNETDGGIDATVLARATPIGRAAIKTADAMVAVGLMDREGPLYILHDFTEYNPSRAELQAKRQADSERKKGKHTASESDRIPTGIQAEPQRIPEPPAGARAPDPVPTRPLPSPESERARAPEGTARSSQTEPLDPTATTPIPAPPRGAGDAFAARCEATRQALAKCAREARGVVPPSLALGTSHSREVTDIARWLATADGVDLYALARRWAAARQKSGGWVPLSWLARDPTEWAADPPSASSIRLTPEQDQASIDDLMRAGGAA